MRRWPQQPCEVCKKPGVLRLKWCSVACAEAKQPRMCAVCQCLKMPDTPEHWICPTHSIYGVAQAALMVLLDAPQADQAGRFVEADTRLSIIIHRLRARASESPVWESRIASWTFQYVLLRYDLVNSLQAPSEQTEALTRRFEEAVRDVDQKYRHLQR